VAILRGLEGDAACRVPAAAHGRPLTGRHRRPACADFGDFVAVKDIDLECLGRSRSARRHGAARPPDQDAVRLPTEAGEASAGGEAGALRDESVRQQMGYMCRSSRLPTTS